MTLAWSFQSHLTWKEMQDRLNAASDQPWTEGDSEYHGDYLAKRLAEHTVARIYAVKEGFVVNLRHRTVGDDEAAAGERMGSAKSVLLERVLPLLLARDVAETEPLD